MQRWHATANGSDSDVGCVDPLFNMAKLGVLGRVGVVKLPATGI